MDKSGFFTKTLLCFACAGLLMPSVSLRAAPPAKKQVVQTHDLTLGSNGLVSGIVVDANGKPLKGAAVMISHNQKKIALTKTDARGQFRVKGLRPGLHTVASAGQIGVYRLWTEKTAPPAAGKKALIVANQGIVRGNLGAGNNELLTGVLVGTAAGVLGGVIGFNAGLDNGGPASP